MKYGFIFSLAVLLSYGSLSADTLYLKNGDRITGTLNSIARGELVFDTEYAGSLRIEMSAVLGLDTEKPYDVNLESETLLSGKLAFVDNTLSVVSDTGSTTIEASAVTRLSENLLVRTAFEPEWSSRVDVNASLSTGNTDSLVFGIAASSTLKKEFSEHLVSLKWDREENNSVTIKDQRDLDYGYKRFLSEQWYLSGNAEYFSDPLKDVDGRITVGAGAGYQFWDNSLGALSADLGASAVYEDLGAETQTNPAVRWALSYKRFLSGKRMEAFHNHQILKILGSGRGAVLSAETGLRYALNAHLDASVQIDLDHETDPAPGQKKSDLTYKIGVGYKF